MSGYTSRHQLLFTVVLLIFYLHAYSCYCYSVACLSCDLVILCLQLFLLLVYAHCLYARALLLHTHSPGRFLTTLDLHVQILDACFYCAGVRCDCTPCEELDALSFDSGILSFLYSYYYF